MTKALTTSTGYTSEQVQLIKNTVAVGATDDELALFMQVCKNHKLDPFTRQVHFVKRKVREKKPDGTWGYREQGTFQISIDGLWTIAERTGCYAGNDDAVVDDEQRPTKATVTVWKIVNAVRCPFTATARWKEYVPTDRDGKIVSPMWSKMPLLMLSKCAEALALRKAFPEAMSGLYTDDEMQQADKDDAKPTPVEVIEPKPAVQVPPEEGGPVPVPTKSKAAPKPPPTATFVMEQLTAATSKAKLDALYANAVKYKWSSEDYKTIYECYTACTDRLTPIDTAQAAEIMAA